ncbi:hypothetical protein GOP47_0029963 [Adiantum capillus-veneris]|nr:hypothetical protein GOP47_0029963 [Adiantum capillus-veneris]
MACRPTPLQVVAGVAILLLGLALPCSLAHIVCEELGIYECAFAVASSGARCILETNISLENGVQFECKTSSVIVTPFADWIETAECLLLCGLDRLTIGISTDFVGDLGLQEMICSSMCQRNCPNIVDIFSNLAIGEGLNLQNLCKDGGTHHFKQKRKALVIFTRSRATKFLAVLITCIKLHTIPLRMF